MSTTHLANVDVAAPADVARWRQRWTAVAVLASVLTLISAFTSFEHFLRGYLIGYMWVLGIALGSLALLMTQHLSGGFWGLVIRRPLEAATRTLPALAVLFIPIAIGMKHLYHWAHADVMAHDHVLQEKAWWLNTPGWFVRALIYFAIWIGLSLVLNRWSALQDSPTDPRFSQRYKAVASVGIILYVFSITLASIDWVMSLDPHWNSTIFGLIFVAGQALSALSFCTAMLILLMRTTRLSEIVKPGQLHDLGKLMLAFTMLWAYFSFSQWLIIWSGNLPEEIGWYLNRIRGGWGAVALLLVILQFALPFMLLLSRDLKRHGRTLLPLALFIIFMRGVDLFWMVVPNFPDTVRNFQFHWAYLVAPIALLGVWIVLFFTYLRTRPLIPLYEPQVPSLLSQSEHGH
jgi:hypothetical protein